MSPAEITTMVKKIELYRELVKKLETKIEFLEQLDELKETTIESLVSSLEMLNEANEKNVKAAETYKKGYDEMKDAVEFMQYKLFMAEEELEVHNAFCLN